MASVSLWRQDQGGRATPHHTHQILDKTASLGQRPNSNIRRPTSNVERLAWLLAAAGRFFLCFFLDSLLAAGGFGGQTRHAGHADEAGVAAKRGEVERQPIADRGKGP